MQSNQPHGGFPGAPPQGPGWGQTPFGPPPQGPGSRGGGRRRTGLVVGCAAVALGLAAACVGAIWWAYSHARDAVEVIQAQATALGQGNYAAVCQHNSPALAAQMPCASYVQWFSVYAPYFPGGTVSMQGFSARRNVGSDGTVEIPVDVSGPRGSGHLTFVLVRVEDSWMVSTVRP